MIGLEVINDLFWTIRREGRSAGVEVGSFGKSFLVFMKDTPEETIHFQLFTLFCLYILSGATSSFTTSLRIS